MSGSASPAAPPPVAVGRHAVTAATLERLADAGALAALVDACDAPGVPARVLARFPDGGACLYQGAEALAFRDRAPYLVRVDRELLAWLLAPAAAGGLAGTPWGVFVVGDAPFAALLRHWRGWLTVTPPADGPSGGQPDGSTAGGGEPWTFRFYDPRLVPVFLGACAPAEAAAFFGPARSLVLPADAPDAPGAPAGWMLTPGAAVYAARAGAGRRAVGERFRLREAHLAAFQRRAFGDALVAGVEREAAAMGQRAWRDPADPAAGDVLVSGAGGAGGPATPPGPPLRIGFDARGFVGAVTSPLGRRWEVASDARGRPLGLVTPAGAALRLRYDARGEVDRVMRRVGGAEQLVYTAEHDAAGRLTRTGFADGTERTTVYAAAPLRIAPGGNVPPFDPGVLDPTGARPAAVTDRLGRTTHYAYDADGDLVAVTDPLGRTTRYQYARWRRPVGVIHPDGRREQYAYDAEGALATLTTGDGVRLRVTADPGGRVTAIASDGRSAGGAGAGVAAVAVHFARDEAGRVVAASTAAAPAPGARATLAVPTAVTCAYDGAGRVLADVATVGAFGPHVPGPDETPHGSPAPGGAPLRTAAAYVYDAQGTLVGLTYPTGGTVGFERDADARLTAVTDWAGRRYTIAYAEGEAGWTLTTPEGLAAVTRQNAVGRPVATEAVGADGRVLFATATGYGAEDRVAGVDDSRLGAWRYGCDAEGQLVACDGPTAAECARYAYDAAGNRVGVREGPAAVEEALPGDAVAVDAGDRLLAQGALRLAYDAAGRAVARDDDAGLGPGGRWRYAYDARGQLVRAWGRGRDGVLRALAFAYDAFGRRVWKLAVERAPGGAALSARRTRFVWAGEQCVREVVEAAAWPAPAGAGRAGGGWATDDPTPDPAADPAAAAAALLDAAMPRGAAWQAVEARDYLHWPGTATPLLLRVTRGPDAPPATYLYHVDHLGAPVRLTDAAGRVAWEAAYAPFGAARETVAAVAQPWRRPGQYWDAELGLCYNRLRYYDPRVGRYLTPDPAGPLGGWHAYRYAGNAPLDDADPLGLWPSLGTVVAAVAAVAVGVVVAAVLAPIAVPLAIIGAGIAAGAAFGLLNEGLNNGFGCLSCLGKATLKGAAVGGLSALPFAFLPAAAGVAAFAGVGAGSGAIGYTADWALNGANPADWSWGGFAGSVAFGAATAGGGRYLQARGAARARAAERAATRARVLGNIEQSRRARASSNFGKHATRERAAAAARQGNSGPAKDLYTRPSGFRRGVRDQVWEQNRGPDGQVRDPGTGQVMNKGQPWDMGHKPGYEFRKHRVSAQERGITRTQFLDEHNDPSHYRPELPSSNRNHAGEDHTDTWFGP